MHLFNRTRLLLGVQGCLPASVTSMLNGNAIFLEKLWDF